MPKAEQMVWYFIRNRQLGGYKFRRQYGVGKYVVDFYCPELKLALEIDGDSHFEKGAAEYDRKRQQYIESFGIRFLRFTNLDIYESMDGVAEVILKFASAVTTPNPSPPKAGKLEKEGNYGK